MRQFIPAALVAFAVVGLPAPAHAQITYPYMPPQYGPFYQTQLSPYLNFLRGGDPAANYFLGVIPEFQRRQNTNQFRAQIGQLQALTAPIINPLAEPVEEAARIPRKLAPSGHPTTFGYTGTFFPGTPTTAAPQRGGAYRPLTEGSTFRR
jgi:hypothetical protein